MPTRKRRRTCKYYICYVYVYNWSAWISINISPYWRPPFLEPWTALYGGIFLYSILYRFVSFYKEQKSSYTITFCIHNLNLICTSRTPFYLQVHFAVFKRSLILYRIALYTSVLVSLESFWLFIWFFPIRGIFTFRFPFVYIIVSRQKFAKLYNFSYKRISANTSKIFHSLSGCILLLLSLILLFFVFFFNFFYFGLIIFVVFQSVNFYLILLYIIF